MENKYDLIYCLKNIDICFKINSENFNTNFNNSLYDFYFKNFRIYPINMFFREHDNINYFK